MNTRILMMASALLMGVVGIVLSFGPQEILGALGQDSNQISVIAIQLMGALYFGFAMTNWMAKGAIIGGIYSRPISVGNFTHFFIGGLALAKTYLNGSNLPLIILLTAIIYLVFSILFGYLLFTHPKKQL
jgi:hypothetical protein